VGKAVVVVEEEVGDTLVVEEVKRGLEAEVGPATQIATTPSLPISKV